MKKPGLMYLSLITALVLVGCAPDPKVVVERTVTDVKSLVREAWSTAESSNRWATLDTSLQALGVNPETRTSSLKVPAISSVDSSLDAVGDRIERVFAEENIVDRSGGALTFRVRGIDVCSDDKGSFSSGCADSVDRLNLHIRTSGDLDVALLVGSDKIEAFVIEIRAGKSLAVIADVEKSVAAVRAFQEAQSNTVPEWNFTATGKVEWRLEKNGNEDFTLSLSVLKDVVYEMTSTDGVTRRASIDAKSPLASIRVEGPAQRATLAYDYGAVRYTGLLRDVYGNQDATRPLEVFLAGAGFTLIFENGKNARLEGVGLGSAVSTVKSGNDTLFSIDFNKNLGGVASASWEPTSQGFKLNITPGLEFDVHVGLGVLESPDYVVLEEHKNANYTASFLAGSGSTPSVEFFTRNNSGAAFAHILEGEFKIAVDNELVTPRVFAAPTCLSTHDGETLNRYVEGLVSVACP